MKKIGIFGTSGFAREVADIASDLGFHTILIAKDQGELDAYGFEGEIVLERDLGQLGDIALAIGVGENAIRQKIASRYSSQKRFANLIHPSATFGKGQRARIDAAQGVIVCAGVRFTNNIYVGDFSIFNLNATIGHDVVVEDFVNVAPGATISGNVHLRTRCWIGTGAAINQGTNESKLEIGPDTVIGSGSVVVKNCEGNAIYVGIPARRIK